MEYVSLIDPELLNIANYVKRSTCLGPGVRAAIWTQFCPFSCPSCYSPQYIPNEPKSLLKPVDLAKILLEDNEIEGISISGGEPLVQAPRLVDFVREVKRVRPGLNFILFTGFQKQWIDRLPEGDSRRDLLILVDVLIDGLYKKELNDNRGLRGSSNQTVWQLTDRLKDYDFENAIRKTEIVVQRDQITFVGVPSRGAVNVTSELERVYVGT